MKVKYSKVRERLQNLINEIPTHADISRVLEKGGLEVSANALSNRLSNDGFLKEEEIEILERKYAIDLSITSDRNSNEATLNYYPDVFASCGNGIMVFDDTSEKISVNKNTIPDYSESATYSVINARGFSMYPVISDNDKVIIKHWQGEQIIDDKIYLFDYKGELFIKRLVKNIDQVIAKSEDKTLEPRPMETSKLTILGRVISLIRTDL